MPTQPYLFLFCLFSSFLVGNANVSSPPNILLILVDDMGWSDIGCYGGEIETPHLDRLAGEGLRFTQFHNTSKCFPSRACLLTGLYAQQVGMARSFERFENGVTLGEVLKTAGYRTYAAGKHHSEENLFDRGFDRYWGLRDGAANHFNPGYQREGEPVPAQKRGPTRWFCFDDEEVQGWTPESMDYYTTDTWTDWAIDFLKEHERDHKAAPFFLYLAYTAPHDPLMAWPEDVEKYRGKYLAGYGAIARARYERQLEMGLIHESDFPYPDPQHEAWETLSPEEQDREDLKMAVYAAMIDRVDQNIGRLIDLLKKQGKYKNTLILFASDNGSSAENAERRVGGNGEIGTVGHWASLLENWANVSNTPLRFYKNFSYQGGICTPFIAWWHDGLIQPGRISEFPAHFIDVMATLVDLTGADYPREHRGQAVYPMAGMSLLPLIKGHLPEPRKAPLFWDWGKGSAIRREPWKLVRHGEEPWELYRIVSDKTETRDLALRNRDKVRELSRLHEQWLREWGGD